MTSVFRRSGSVTLFSLLVLLSVQTVLASSSGSLSGLIQDQSGHPLSHVLISLLQKSSEYALPILARSDGRGRIHLAEIDAGDYELSIKNSRYRGPIRKLVEVLPGETTAVRVVLQQLFQLTNFEEDNLSIKTLLRRAPDGRLIFRSLPGQSAHLSAERPSVLFGDDVVFEVFSSAGLSDDYLIFPNDAAGGSASNFAVVQALSGGGKYVLAGQLNSGEDSLWRLKNFIQIPFSERHSLEAFAGYGRVSFTQPSSTLLDNPISLGVDPGFTQALSSIRVLSLGFQERFLLSKNLSVLWGLEVDQVDTDRRQSFLSPNAEIRFTPSSRTQVSVLMASKRNTHTGSLELPDGDVVNLRDAVYFSRIGDQFAAGSSRHYRSSISQQLTENTQIELAAYKDHLFGGTSSFLAIPEGDSAVRVLNPGDEQGEIRGYRVMVTRRLGSILSTSVAYVRGSAMGVDGDLEGLVSQALNPTGLLENRKFHGVSTQLEAYIPFSRTHVNALLKFIPNGHPITILDSFSDTYETGNEGIHLFVRQVVPMPENWLTFLGLDFMSEYEIEALLDIRNLANDDLGVIHTDAGKFSLVRNPRTVRGGISVRF
jgi:hypothetical protein